MKVFQSITEALGFLAACNGRIITDVRTQTLIIKDTNNIDVAFLDNFMLDGLEHQHFIRRDPERGCWVLTADGLKHGREVTEA